MCCVGLILDGIHLLVAVLPKLFSIDKPAYGWHHSGPANGMVWLPIWSTIAAMWPGVGCFNYRWIWGGPLQLFQQQKQSKCNVMELLLMASILKEKWWREWRGGGAIEQSSREHVQIMLRIDLLCLRLRISAECIEMFKPLFSGLWHKFSKRATWACNHPHGCNDRISWNYSVAWSNFHFINDCHTLHFISTTQSFDIPQPFMAICTCVCISRHSSGISAAEFLAITFFKSMINPNNIFKRPNLHW